MTIPSGCQPENTMGWSTVVSCVYQLIIQINPDTVPSSLSACEILNRRNSLLYFISVYYHPRYTTANCGEQTMVRYWGLYPLWDPTVCTCWMYQYCVLYLALWWFNWTEKCRQIFNLITNTCCAIDWINYRIIAKHNGMAPTKLSFSAHHRLFLWGLTQVVTSNPLL
jgi:hypothetical protein